MIQINLLTNSWLQLDIEMGDITIVKLKGTWGMLTVFNIYNNCDHNNTIKLVSKIQRDLDNFVQHHLYENTHTI